MLKHFDNIKDRHMDPFNILNNIIQRLSILVLWLIFAVFHLTLLMIATIVIWSMSITPAQIATTITTAFQQEPVATAAETLGFLGLSVPALAWAYVRIWRKIYASLATSYLLKDL